MPIMLKRISIGLLAIFFITAGILHFAKTAVFMQIMPPWLPYGLALIYISGVCEILGGIALLIPRLRRLSGYCLIALLIAVFPVNINMAVHGSDFSSVPAVALWLRLPLQFVLIAWIWFSTDGKRYADMADSS